MLGFVSAAPRLQHLSWIVVRIRDPLAQRGCKQGLLCVNLCFPLLGYEIFPAEGYPRSSHMR